MKKILLDSLCVLACVFVFSIASTESAYAAKTARIEVLYMNHGPLMDTLDRMKDVFSSYGDKISVSWYDFESKEGEDFKAKKGINRHVPLVIWIDGNTVVKLGQEQVSFVGFPTGAGPAFFQGKWTMDDLRTALDQATAGK
ncbi:MAG: hypothetical protein LJE96_00750 [Deltaproteobacteria bacterium]|nr:hypothetical protein [Deltaproteobacteria bacterium]